MKVLRKYEYLERDMIVSINTIRKILVDDKIDPRNAYEVTADSIIGPEGIRIGDKLIIDLDKIINLSFGQFTATVQQITNEETILLFDKCVTKRQINNTYIDKYRDSQLHKWINDVLLFSFPEEIQRRISYIDIPKYGQIFGNMRFRNRSLEPIFDNDETQFKYIEKSEPYWLQNEIMVHGHVCRNAYVESNGIPHYGLQTGRCGVRPVLKLKNTIYYDTQED